MSADTFFFAVLLTGFGLGFVLATALNSMSRR
jgi:hypothetical protein